MEKPMTGLTASLKIGESDLGYVSGVDLDISRDIIEVLSLGKTYKEKIPSIKDWSVSIDGTLALATGSTQKDLYDAFEDGTPLTIGVYVDPDTYFEGTAYVSSFKISVSADDKINLSSELAGSGGVTLEVPTEEVPPEEGT